MIVYDSDSVCWKLFDFTEDLRYKQGREPATGAALQAIRLRFSVLRWTQRSSVSIQYQRKYIEISSQFDSNGWSYHVLIKLQKVLDC